jgi:hypothetical protein
MEACESKAVDIWNFLFGWLGVWPGRISTQASQILEETTAFCKVLKNLTRNFQIFALQVYFWNFRLSCAYHQVWWFETRVRHYFFTRRNSGALSNHPKNIFHFEKTTRQVPDLLHVHVLSTLLEAANFVTSFFKTNPPHSETHSDFFVLIFTCFSKGTPSPSPLPITKKPRKSISTYPRGGGGVALINGVR